MTTTWPAIRSAFKAVIAIALDCDEAQVRWSSDYQPCTDLQVRLSVVSEISDAQARRELNEDNKPVLTEEKRMQIGCLIETSEGEAEQIEYDAQALASKLRLVLQRDTIREALKEAGIQLVQEPGPIRIADYESREDDVWVCARYFEIPIRCSFEDVDEDFSLGEITRVTGTSTLADGETVEIDVEKP